MRVTRLSTFGVGLTFTDSDRVHYGSDDVALPPLGNVCQGCGQEMPLDDEKMYVPGRGSFHIACAPPE